MRNEPISLSKKLKITDFSSIIQQPNLDTGNIHVTLTYAQTLDGFIGVFGSRLELSGPESYSLTHALRSQRDAILVGIGTILNEDPMLTARIPGNDCRQPIPVIVDTNLRTPIESKCITSRVKLGRKPIILCGFGAENTRLEGIAHVIRLPASGNGVDLAEGIKALQDYGIKSLMIEGGAAIIKECICSSTIDIQELIITISPQYLMHGVHSTYKSASEVLNAAKLMNPKWHVLGSDCILTANLTKS